MKELIFSVKAACSRFWRCLLYTSSAKEGQYKEYTQDSICGTWEILADIVYEGGIKKFKKDCPTYREVGKYKAEWAEKIGDFFDIDNNKSCLLYTSILDIDYFKQYNDEYGHQAGDECVKAIAGLLAGIENENIFCARYGGDEFVIVYAGVEAKEVKETAEKLRQQVYDLNIQHNGSSEYSVVTISQGICHDIPGEDCKDRDFLRAAYEYLYAVKKKVRNAVCIGNLKGEEIHYLSIIHIWYDDLRPVFCDELIKQELDNDNAYIDIPQEILDFYKMYRPAPLVRAYCLETVSYTHLGFGVPADYYKIDLSIARGLDYYTGTVYETFIKNHPEYGSVCSGGRYDNLAEYYTKKSLPGVGISIGLTRLFYVLCENNFLNRELECPVDALVVPMTDDMTYAVRTATGLRAADINTQIYLEGGKFKKKLTYGSRLTIPFCIILGTDEIDTNQVTIKNMNTGEQKTTALQEAISIINNQKELFNRCV